MLQDPARHFLGSMVAGKCLFNMASRRCGKKRHTAPTGATGRQQDSYGGEKANRDYSFFAAASLAVHRRDICLQQLHAS